MDSIAAVIPAFQAADILPGTLAELPRSIPVCVVDDGSRDNTAAVAQACGVWQVLRQDRRRGPGAAVQAGLTCLQAAGFHIAVVLDADGQMDTTYLEALVRPILAGQAALVRGSRLEHASRGRDMPWIRRQAAQSLAPLASQQVGVPISDPLSGYIALDLNYRPDWLWPGFGYPMHLAAQVRALGGSIEHVPVPVLPARAGRSHHGLHRLLAIGGALWAAGQSHQSP